MSLLLRVVVSFRTCNFLYAEDRSFLLAFFFLGLAGQLRFVPCCPDHRAGIYYVPRIAETLSARSAAHD